MENIASVAAIAVALVTMFRAEPQFEGGPTTAEVHPDEVDNYVLEGWSTEAPAEAPVPDALDPDPSNQSPPGTGGEGSGASNEGDGGQTKQTITLTIEQIDALADADAVRAAAAAADVKLQAFPNTGADALKAQLKKKLGLTA